MKKCRAAALLLTVLFLLCACTGSPRQESTPITITLKAPFQEMNCISDPEVTNVQMFLERALHMRRRPAEGLRSTCGCSP